MPNSIAIIGGGAAGCFAAAVLSGIAPDCAIDVYEADNKLLAKVAITGGGRCNLTNTFESVGALSEAYPRGSRLMKGALRAFSAGDTCEWFRAHGVRLKVEDGGRVFPVSDDAMQIVRTLENELRRSGVRIHTGRRVTSIRPGFEICFEDGSSVHADRVLVTVGGKKDFGFLSPLGLEIVPPVPSLYSFNLEDKAFRSLMGTVAEDVEAYLPGTKFRARGSLLVTDWGCSGPAVLKLSSYAARHLAEAGWKGMLGVKWLPSFNENSLREYLASIAADNPRRLVRSAHPAELPARLWGFLTARAGIPDELTWSGLVGVGKSFSRLVNTLLSDQYTITGRGAFRDEFVTAGGLALSCINPATMECKTHPGLFFAGEVLDIDAITGGFNLQAAWTTATLAARSLEKE